MDYRLSAALILSISLHITVLLSSGSLNSLTSLTKAKPPQLEIVLTPKAPSEVLQKSAAERRPVPKPTPSPPSESQRASAQSVLTPSLSSKPMAEKNPPEPKASTHMQATESQPLTQSQSSVKTDPPIPQPALPEDSDKTLSKSLPSARELIATLDEQLAREVQRYAFQPRKRYINSSTREYAAAAYLNSWCKKIERIGKLNYPEEAKRQGLSGSLVLVVDLYPDGTVANIIVRQSSGYQALDEAAIRIVQLAAPFAKVSENVLQGYDILSITRTWHFRSGLGFHRD